MIERRDNYTVRYCAEIDTPSENISVEVDRRGNWIITHEGAQLSISTDAAMGLVQALAQLLDEFPLPKGMKMEAK